MISPEERDLLIPHRDVIKGFGITLEPCPFCQHPRPGLISGPAPYVVCVECSASGPKDAYIRNDRYARVGEALQRWNLRQPLALRRDHKGDDRS